MQQTLSVASSWCFWTPTPHIWYGGRVGQMAIVDELVDLQNVVVIFGGKCRTFVKCRKIKLTFILDICQRKCQGQPYMGGLQNTRV